jgi:zinc transport system substrate-binding protein
LYLLSMSPKRATPCGVRKRLSVLVVLFLFPGLLGPAGAEDDPAVSATIFPLGDLLQQVAGEGIEVVVILPPNASPHGFEPTPGIARRISKASAHFLIGLGLDDWLEPFLKATGAADEQRIRLGERIDVAGVSDISVEEDPHLWMDTRLARLMVLQMGEVLSETFPDLDGDPRARAAAVADSLLVLESQLTNHLEPCRGMPLVAEHGVWQRFAERFGLNVAALIEPWPGQEPSARRLSELTRLIREKDVRLIVLETQVSDRTAKVLALESGAGLVTLDPIGGTPGHESYQELMISNAEELATACKTAGANR